MKSEGKAKKYEANIIKFFVEYGKFSIKSWRWHNAVTLKKILLLSCFLLIKNNKTLPNIRKW